MLNSEEIRWGFENLNITKERIKEIGAEGFMEPLKITCADHEGGGNVFFQQWDGEKWVMTGIIVEPMKEFVREMIEKSADAYAKENKIEIRECK
ncbi:MAG TPA: hypothetical protein HPP58_03790 [Deltaproteobacteria bacterium]|nr:hypothetical protein [Deltaproteobacteria bacterium]